MAFTTLSSVSANEEKKCLVKSGKDRILKVESVYPKKQLPSFTYARDFVARFIRFYNHHRPHMSIGYKVPAVAHMEQGEQKKKWKSKDYGRKEADK